MVLFDALYRVMARLKSRPPSEMFGARAIMRTPTTLLLIVTAWLAAVPASAQQVSVWLTTDDQHS